MNDEKMLRFKLWTWNAHIFHSYLEFKRSGFYFRRVKICFPRALQWPQIILNPWMRIFRVSIIQLHYRKLNIFELEIERYRQIVCLIQYIIYCICKQTCAIDVNIPESELIDLLSQLQRPAGPKSLKWKIS